jgi:hypothetical protein
MSFVYALVFFLKKWCTMSVYFCMALVGLICQILLKIDGKGFSEIHKIFHLTDLPLSTNMHDGSRSLVYWWKGKR